MDQMKNDYFVNKMSTFIFKILDTEKMYNFVNIIIRNVYNHK